MQWSDLYRHMPDRKLADGATEEERRRLNFRLLQENPHIAASYLYRRWNLFFTYVLKEVFDIDDHWFDMNGNCEAVGIYTDCIGQKTLLKLMN